MTPAVSLAIFVISAAAFVVGCFALQRKARWGAIDVMWLSIALVAAIGSALMYRRLTAEGGPEKAVPNAPEAVQTPATAALAAPDGKAIYMQRCAACHQADGSGLARVYPPIAGAEVAAGDPAQHVKIVLDGQSGPIQVAGKPYSGTMPGWKAVLSAEEVAAVVNFERTAFGNHGATVSVADVVAAGGKTRGN